MQNDLFEIISAALAPNQARIHWDAICPWCGSRHEVLQHVSEPPPPLGYFETTCRRCLRSECCE